MEMQGGFSIREYASRMRSVNVVNCWPFDETSSEETVKSLLPPITVKKFTWWLDVVEYIPPESAKNSGKKKKRAKKGETSSRNEDQDIDEYVEVNSLKGKMKAQKKRSIVEIFAVAPPVERVISEEEEEDSIDEDAKTRRRRRRRRRRKKNTDGILRKALRVVKKIKKKKSQKQFEMGQSLPDKENIFKPKPQAQDKASGDPSASYSKELEHNTRDFVSTLKRKPSLQHLDAYKKTMFCDAFKSIEENQHPSLPMHGILKNHGESLFPPKQSTEHIIQEAVQTDDCNTKKANKHVTFSKKDEILRLSRKSSHSVEFYNVQKVCGSDMSNIDSAGDVGKDSIIVESSGSEDASTGIEKEVEQLITCIVNSTNFTKKNKEEDPFRRPEASDRSSLHHVNQDWPHNPMDGCASGYCRTPLDGYYNNPNIKVIRNSSTSICRRLNKDLGKPGLISPPMRFDDCLRTYDEPSLSHLPNMEKRKYSSVESTFLNNAHSFQFQTFPHLSPKELMNTFSSSPEGSQTGNVCGRWGINGPNEDFVRLPLNSQGELITLNPSATEREVNQMMNSSVSSERSLSCGESSMDQLNLFPIESNAKENPIAVMPSILGITESQSESKTNLDIDFLEMNYHSFLDSENIMFKGSSQVHKSHENEKIQSTMRLMGKEFKVGGTGLQGFEEGNIWKDKQIINDLHFGHNFTSNVVHDQNELSSEKLRETLCCPSETAIYQRSESKYALPHFDHQTSSMYPNVFVASKIDPIQKMYTSFSPNNFSEVYSDNESLFSEPFTSGYESPFFTLDLPTPRGAHHEACPSMNPSARQLKKKQNLLHSSISSIRFPFMHPDLDGHAVSSWGRRSSVNRAPLCFDVPKKATQLGNTQSYSSLGRNHPYIKPAGSSHGIDSSASLKPDDSRMFFPLSSGSSSEMCVAPMPYYPGILMQKRHGNPKKFQERNQSRIGSRVLDNGKKLKGQLSALSTVPFKPFKMPTLGPHENIQCAIRKPTDISKSVMYGEYEANQVERIISPWVDSRIDTARTGPVKLSGGAKHILKACQQKNQSSSRPIDQDISLSATNFRFSESENSAKIYRFSGKAPV